MTYQELASRNITNNLGELLVYTNDISNGLFMPLVLFAFFMIVTLGSYFSQQRMSGKGDFPTSFAVGGFLTAGLSYIMLLKDGLINVTFSILATLVAIGGALWIFFPSKE